MSKEVSMKLLSDFNADDMASKLQEPISAMRCPFELKPTTIVNILYYDHAAELINKNWSHRHKQQALLKSLKLLQKLGEIEIVSLTKTKLTLGLLHKKTGRSFKLSFDPKFMKDFGRLLVPSRYLKHGEWY